MRANGLRGVVHNLRSGCKGGEEVCLGVTWIQDI